MKSPRRRRRPGGDAAPSPARSVALKVLLDWSAGNRHAADWLKEHADQHRLSAPDRALAMDLVLTVLRNLSLLAHWVGHLTDHRDLDDRTAVLLRMGLAELLLLDMAEHAAVHETVSLAKRSGGLVNAVLRRTCRERAELLAAGEELPAAVRYSHPPFLVERWEQQLGSETTEAILRWNQQPASVYVRRNRLHPDHGRLEEVEGLADLGRGFFRCERLPLEALRSGWCYAQDPSTAMAPRLLDPQSGDRVLDACAAPGGKTALLAELMENRGELIAVDLPGPRLERLTGNLQRLQATVVQVCGHDWSDEEAVLPEAIQAGGFDRILLDVPCSNTGVMGRRVDVRWRVEASEMERLVELQQQMVERCLPLLKVGGHLAYSTCSIDAEENEIQIQRLLQRFPQLEEVEAQLLLPPESKTDGAFAALLRRLR